MPSRMVREDILSSERYWRVSAEAQQLFVHLLLCVDDYGCFTASNFALRTKCFPGRTYDPQSIERMLMELVDADLVRVYESDGARYLFVPRFRQRFRAKNPKYPLPPKEISDLTENLSDMSASNDGRMDDKRRSYAGHVTAETRRDETRRDETKNKNPLAQADGFARFWDAYPKRRSKGQAEKAWTKLKPSEQLVAEIIAAIERAKTSEQWRKDAGQFIPYPATWLDAKGWQDDGAGADPVLTKIRERYPDTVQDGRGYYDPGTQMRFDSRGEMVVV